MNTTSKYLLLIWIFALGCDSNDPDLPSVEQRRSEALQELRDELTSPSNGWKINYQPTPESGSFLMILKFDEDGNVNIQSDLAADDGTYFNQTITYRLDAGLSLELIFETYGVFHYLFELDQASFGAEFEFLFDEEDNGNLYFYSKTDAAANLTQIVFEPANATDANAFSREISENFDSYTGQSPQFYPVNPSQQLYLTDQDFSIFWSVDLSKRSLSIDLAGKGSTIQEVLADNYQNVSQSRGYSFSNGSLVLDNPVSINSGDVSFSLQEISLNEFSNTGAELCAGSGQTTPVYSVNVPGEGKGILTKNLINSTGFDFANPLDQLYSVNIPFIFDGEQRSLYEEGSIAENLPNAIAFLMTLGIEHDTIPANSVGFILEYENDSTELYLRNFDLNVSGNLLEISLLDEFYHSGHTGSAAPGEEQALIDITNEIFEGGAVYAYYLPIRGLTAYELFNPCNGYEFILVQ